MSTQASGGTSEVDPLKNECGVQCDVETRKWALALAIQAANAAPRGEISPVHIERWAQRFCRFAMLGVFDEHLTAYCTLPDQNIAPMPKATIPWGPAAISAFATWPIP